MLEPYKEWVIYELSGWAETFEDDRDKEGEPTKGTDIIIKLADKLERNTCSKKDYEEILFHLWQLAHGKPGWYHDHQ